MMTEPQEGPQEQQAEIDIQALVKRDKDIRLRQFQSIVKRAAEELNIEMKAVNRLVGDVAVPEISIKAL